MFCLALSVTVEKCKVTLKFSHTLLAFLPTCPFAHLFLKYSYFTRRYLGVDCYISTFYELQHTLPIDSSLYFSNILFCYIFECFYFVLFFRNTNFIYLNIFLLLLVFSIIIFISISFCMISPGLIITL